MKRKISILATTIILLFIVSPSIAQLNGTYTIGGISPNYTTINEAIDSLTSQGVAGPVIFNIRTGTYNEQFAIGSINGASSTNNITFKSETNTNTDVDIIFSPTVANLYITELNDAHYVTFNYLSFTISGTSYSKIFNLRYNTSDIILKNCVLNGRGVGSSVSQNHALIGSISGNNDNYNNITITNNIFNNGSYGIDIRGNSSSFYCLVDSNTFVNQSFTPINLEYFDTTTISNNIINSNSTVGSFNGIRVSASNELLISSNKISIASYHALYINSCNGTPTNKGRIINNFISIVGTGDSRGIFLNWSNYIGVYHNNFNIITTNFGQVLTSWYGGNNEALNNNFVMNANANNSRMYGISGNSFSVVDYNNIYNYGNGFINTPGDCIQSLPSFGYDVNSISVNPFYVSNTDLHVSNIFLNNRGTTTSVTNDIDYVLRNATTPDIGATEFTPSNTPMTGTYTIGATGNYNTINQAIDSLETFGISSNVTFEIQTGIYNEQIDLGAIAGANDSSIITFKSQTLNPNDVIITYNGVYNWRLENTNNISFENLTFESTSSSIGTAIELINSAKNITFLNNVFNINYSGFNTIKSEINSCANYIKTDNLSFIGNQFNGGKYSIYLEGGNNTNHSLNSVIKDNTFATFNDDAITLINQEAPIIENNSITETTNTAIHLSYCSEAIRISKNQVIGTHQGLVLENCVSTIGNEGLISNNFLNPGSPSQFGVYGISIDQCSNQLIYHNSINLLYSALAFGGNTCLYSSASLNCEIKNNIFKGQDWIFDVDSLINFDYNDFHTVTAVIGRFNGISYLNLSSLQAATGTNLNTIFVDPNYNSNNDLHVSNTLLGAGTSLPIIMEDIDGETRYPYTPYIGADEICQNTINSTVICQGDSTLIFGNYQNIPGVYYDTLQTISGCDSTYSTTLTVITTYYPTLNDTICQGDSLLIYGIYRNTAGIYYDSLQNINGCDSILSTSLTVNPVFFSNLNQSICQGDSILISGIYQNSTGVYYDSLQTNHGCDSIVAINLNVPNHNANYTFTDNGNGNYSFTNTSTGNFNQSHWAFGDGTIDSIANPNHTFTTNGVFTVILTINDSTTQGDSCISYFIDIISVTGIGNPLPCHSGFAIYPDTINNNINVVNSSTGNNLTYLWDFGDGNTSTPQNPSHTYATTGPFYLCLTVDDGNGCNDMYCDSIGKNGIIFNKVGGFTINVTSLNTTEIDNNIDLNSEVAIYPNPASNQLTIDTELKISEMNIIDIMGKTIVTTKKNTNTLNVTDLSTGIYFIQLITEERIITKKFIKQ